MPVIGDAIGLTLEQVLVATDFSPVSELAVDYAALLASRFAAKLTVAHVVDLSMAVPSEQEIVGTPLDALRRENAEKMETLLTGLHLGGVQALGRILEANNPALEVVRFANDIRANLVVLGTHSRGVVEKMILGSFAEDVIHHASSPVLTIGPKVKVPPSDDIPFRTIVFATDLHHDAVQKAAIALAFAKDSLARICMVHVISHPPDDLTSSLQMQLACEKELSRLIPEPAYDWCSPGVSVEYGRVAEELLAVANRERADLIVMGARRNTMWLTHPGQGVVARVLAESRCPVMTICTP